MDDISGFLKFFVGAAAIALGADLLDFWFYYQYLEARDLPLFSLTEFGDRLGYLKTLPGAVLTTLGIVPWLAIWLYAKILLRNEDD